MFSAGFRPHPDRPDLDVIAVDHRPEGRRCDGAQGERAGRQYIRQDGCRSSAQKTQAHVLARRVRPHDATNATEQQGGSLSIDHAEESSIPWEVHLVL